MLFSYEEAIGFCIGDIVRDKDGVVAAGVFTEMAQYLKNEKQLSVTQHLDQLCQKYGYFAQYNGYLYWRDQKKSIKSSVDCATMVIIGCGLASTRSNTSVT